MKILEHQIYRMEGWCIRAICKRKINKCLHYMLWGDITNKLYTPVYNTSVILNYNSMYKKL